MSLIEKLNRKKIKVVKRNDKYADTMVMEGIKKIVGILENGILVEESCGTLAPDKRIEPKRYIAQGKSNKPVYIF
ncbi:hypothetical protein [Neobacillus drentensis]